MMETIASWIADALSELLELIISLFLNLMSLNLGTIAGQFPYLVTGFRMFQAVGVGLIICVSVFQIFKFFGGQLVEVNDTPARILLRAFIAGFLIFFGGYFVEMIVNIAALPYQAFVDNSDPTNDKLFVLTPLTDFSLDALFINASQIAFGTSTIIIAYVLLMGAIGWNIVKLLIEILERYLMVALLAFTAPVFYSTLTSQSTSSIFKNWVNMLIGQCALMGVSAWMLKLIISGFSYSPESEGMAFQLLLTFALCRIALRIDTYMQSLGLGTVTTGGHLLDEMLMGAGALSRMGNQNDNQRASSGKPLEDKENGGNVVENQPRRISDKVKDMAKPAPGGILHDIDKMRYFGHDAKQAIQDSIAARQNGEEDGRNPFKNFKDIHNAGEPDPSTPVETPDTGDFDGYVPFYQRDRDEQLNKGFGERFIDAKAYHGIPDGQALLSRFKNANSVLAENFDDNNLTTKAQEVLDPNNFTETTVKSMNAAQTDPKDSLYGGVALDADNNVVPDSYAQDNGISIDNGRIQSDNADKTAGYLNDNIGALSANDNGTSVANETLQSDSQVAESFLESSSISSSASENPSNVNSIGQTAMESTFEGGVESITGNEVNKIENFSTTQTDKGSQISFTTTDANGSTTAYDVYSGDAQNANDMAIKSANGSVWHVNKRDNVDISKFDMEHPTGQPMDHPMPNEPNNH